MAKFKITLAPKVGQIHSEIIEREAERFVIGKPDGHLHLEDHNSQAVHFYPAGSFLAVETVEEPKDIEALRRRLEMAFNAVMSEELMRHGYVRGQGVSPTNQMLIGAFAMTIGAALFREGDSDLVLWNQLTWYQDEIKAALERVLKAKPTDGQPADAINTAVPAWAPQRIQKNPIAEDLYAQLMSKISPLTHGEDGYAEGSAVSAELTGMLVNAMVELEREYAIHPIVMASSAADLPMALLDRTVGDCRVYPRAGNA